MMAASEPDHLAGYITAAVARAFKEDDPPWSLLGYAPGGFRLRGEHGTYIVTVRRERDAAEGDPLSGFLARVQAYMAGEPLPELSGAEQARFIQGRDAFLRAFELGAFDEEQEGGEG